MVLVRKSERREVGKFKKKYAKLKNNLPVFLTFPTSGQKTYVCLIILKGCLALSNQTERQAEIKPIVVNCE